MNAWFSLWFELFSHIEANSDDKLPHHFQFLYISTSSGHKVLGISEASQSGFLLQKSSLDHSVNSEWNLQPQFKTASVCLLFNTLGRAPLKLVPSTSQSDPIYSWCNIWTNWQMHGSPFLSENKLKLPVCIIISIKLFYLFIPPQSLTLLPTYMDDSGELHLSIVRASRVMLIHANF